MQKNKRKLSYEKKAEGKAKESNLWKEGVGIKQELVQSRNRGRQK